MCGDAVPPLYVTPPMPTEMFDSRRIVCVRRAERDNWDLIPPRHVQPAGGGKLRAFRGVRFGKLVDLAVGDGARECPRFQKKRARKR